MPADPDPSTNPYPPKALSPLPADKPYRHPMAILRFAGVTVLGLALDLWAKSAAVARLKYDDGVAFIPGYLRFDYTENHGAVFGVGQGQRTLFIAVSIAAIAFLSYLFSRSGRQRWYQVVLGMLLAGVLGNLWDRIEYGYVRDMIHALPGWKWPGWLVSALPATWDWPRQDVFPYIFNVADSLLVCGVAILLVHSFVTAPRKQHEAAAPAPEAAS